MDIDHIGQRLRSAIQEDRQMQAIEFIPGVGELTASALVGSGVADRTQSFSSLGWRKIWFKVCSAYIPATTATTTVVASFA